MFLAIHAGAGYHSPKNDQKYHKLINSVLLQTRDLMLNGASAENAVELAIKLLETHPLTNAGIAGSNITMDGSIECDACIMNEYGYGAVGAMPLLNINSKSDELVHPHPITVAKAVLERQLNGPDAIGRVPPLFVGGNGANVYAKECGLETKKSEDLHSYLSQAQLKRYQNHLDIYGEAQKERESKSKHSVYESLRETGQNNDEDDFQDTVGAIAIDLKGNLACGVSSGGISLKRNGRIGEAAVAGAGLWLAESETRKIGCSISGTGEQIMKCMLASTLTNSLIDSCDIPDTLGRVFRKSFLDSKKLAKEVQKMAGALIVIKDEDSMECWWIHSTPSFCIGTIGGQNSKPRLAISRKQMNNPYSLQGTNSILNT